MLLQRHRLTNSQTVQRLTNDCSNYFLFVFDLFTPWTNSTTLNKETTNSRCLLKDFHGPLLATSEIKQEELGSTRDYIKKFRCTMWAHLNELKSERTWGMIIFYYGLIGFYWHQEGKYLIKAIALTWTLPHMIWDCVDHHPEQLITKLMQSRSVISSDLDLNGGPLWWIYTNGTTACL